MLPARTTGLWARHWPALTAFFAVSTQWRVTGVGLGGILTQGLDYTAMRAGLDMAGIEITPKLFAQIREIEIGALEHLNRT
ncbi:hypothetical protein D2T29_19615 [Sinirhodobacter populi]|uniref:Uncharacterized protein n=1 Tax=Paenirhodobacter populi TaxID=2306993 RepID=A0A443K237_9RHOB|nr:DUF1799 domain-containing protein [Sinirhodobacter populi]RWR26829.1 hypothetical protein D2T29_19615 [Sinirhodobacter populi]